MTIIRLAVRALAWGLAAALLAAAAATGAQAQIQLPGIVVTSPSPVAGSVGSSAEASSATPTGIALEDAFAAVTVVPSQDVLADPGANLADALQTRPGITGSTFAPGANRPIIRGLDNFRVRIQENGIGSHDVSALSEDHAVPIDPFAADRDCALSEIADPNGTDPDAGVRPATFATPFAALAALAIAIMAVPAVAVLPAVAMVAVNLHDIAADASEGLWSMQWSGVGQ